MKDLGDATYILGIKIYRDRSRRLIGLCQSAYIEKILKRFHVENSKRGSIPMQDKLRLSKSQGASTLAKLKRMQNVPIASAVGFYMYVVNVLRPDCSRIKEEIPYLITMLPFVGLIYENSKKRNRIMNIDEISKFCDATLKMVLEKVKRINIDVKHGYANLALSNPDADLMMFYEEYIQDRLKHQDQMRRWKSYVNGRPLRLRNERP
ncbi:hypothetical protein Tco_0032004 [Tanacetum coccineum]